ncbi:unnamed protein product [Rhizoctonia solani]|uniref:Uncharacterized protein n=1 Tax=Rhizoctonia solani TaxID=456999 RepID=A0A8H3HYV8_9AGAM|nr:unnamed protein product [Rhizoctonia solani]
MNYPPNDDDPVIWQPSQAAALKLMFADDPAPPPSTSASGTRTVTGNGNGPQGVKRKRRKDQDTPGTTSTETQWLCKEVSRALGGGQSNSNPGRRNTRVASAGNIVFCMPPPKLKPPSSDEASTSDGTSLNWSRSSTTSPLVIGKSLPEPSLGSKLTAIPRTPPKKILLGPRPSTEPTMQVSELLDHARAESPELPPPPAPAKPVISIRTDSDTVNKSTFSTRSNTSESTTSTTNSGSFVSTTAPSVSPTTPIVALLPRPDSPGSAETILDLTETSPTPSPEPKIVRKAPSRPKSPIPASKPPTEASRPVRGATRSITGPNPPKRLPSLSSQHTRSEPSQSFKPLSQAFKPPTQQTFNPPTQAVSKRTSVVHLTQQQNPRTFPSSQTRLGLGAMGKGYSGVNTPFKVPNKGKGTVPLVEVPFKQQATKGPPSPSRKKENIDAGRGKRGNSPAPAARPTTRQTSGLSSRTTSGSSLRTSVSSTRTPSSRTTGKHTQSRRASGSKREQGSDDSYSGSDDSFDAAAVDADMAIWDSWVD